MGNEVKQDQVKQLIPNAAIFSASQEIISSTQSHSILQALFDCVTSAEELCEAAIYSPFSSNLANIQQTHYWRNQQLSYLPDGPIVTLGSVLDLSGAPISSYFLLDSLADSPDVPEYLRDLGSTVGFNQTLVFPIGYQNSLFGFLHITPQKTRPVLPEDIAPLMMLCKQTGLAFWQIQQERERIALDQLNHDLNHAVTHEDAGETVVSILADYSKVDNTRLFLIDSNTQSARLLIENNSTFSDFEGSPSWDDPLIFQFSHTQEPILIHANAPGEFQSAADRYLNPFHYETSLVVPIFNQLILNGFVILDSRQRNFVFSPEIIAFTIKIAKQFEIRYENLLLYDEAFKRAQELIQLNQFGERLSSTLVPQELTSIVYETTQQLFDAPIFMLGLIDHDHELITPILYKSNQRQINAKPSKISRHSSITAQIRSQETTICWQNDPLLTELYQILAVDDAAFPVTGVFAPIIQSGFGSGFIAILAFEQDIYKPDHIQLIRSIANQTGLCLSNSALLEKSENHVSELRSLFNVTQAMANGISAEERITNSLRTLHLSLDQSKVALILLDKENRVESISHNGFSNSDLDYLIEVLVQESMTDTPNLVERRIRVNGKHPNGWPIGEQYQIVVPFHLSSGERGGLILEHGDDEIINEQTLRLLQTLSVSFAATLENGQLFEQIEAANERLRELDRLKTQFLANMSHELRTPLNSIIGFSKLILRGIDGPITEAQEDDLTSIYYSGQHLLKLINDILDLTKLEAGKMPMSFESVDLVPIAEGTFVTTRGLIREEFVKLILDVADDLPQIEADPLRIKQIILNLLSNAAKFTATGSITLKLEKDTIFDDHVVISVQDTGTGIATDDLPKLFELFEQGRHARMIGASGTGLGLPIVKELVQLHHGSIDVKSALDKGTTFFVTLPVSQPEAIVDELADLPAYTVSSANEREEKESFEFSSSPLLPIPTSSNGDHPAILLVDDEPSVLKLYQRYLSNQPNEIICAVNGIEALTHLKKRSAEIGLVILDIHMPGLNGWDVLAEMRSSEALAHIPVAICSLDVDSTRAMNSGAQMVLHKPIISEDLSRVLSLTNRKSSEQA